MIKFTDYINENTLGLNEAFSSGNLVKAVKNIKRVLEKTIGSKLYPFYGDQEVEKFTRSGGIGIGIAYIVDKTDALVRFNWEQKKKSNTITSVDIWNKVSDVDIKPPTSTLDIPTNFNIIQSLGIIANFIKKPRVGIVTEAKGDVKRKLAMEWGLDPEQSYADIKKAITKKKRLVASKGVTEKNQVMQDVNDAQKKLDAEKYADPTIVFEDLDDLVRMVATNIQPSLLVTGMAGIGKCVYSNTEIDVVFD